jgi:XTP/dITP diphosphohydrolase
MRLVLASHNAKKLQELRSLFSELPLQLVPQGELQIPEAEEPYISFVENALAKARAAAQLSGGAAIADDSGLCVQALAGAPGVISAHYGGLVPALPEREATRRLQDAANNRLLLQRLQGLGDRRARFVCTLVALRHAQDPEPLIAFGRWEGELLTAPQGDFGFGYDPLMFIPEAGCTVAQMEPEQKNRMSHRALAAQQMLGLMRCAWGLRGA